VASDLPISHAAHELLPRGLVIRAELHTRLSGVVEEFIVADPEGGIPGLVVCPTVVGGVGSGAHVSFVWYVRILQGQGCRSGEAVTVCPLSFGGVAAEPQHLKDLPAVNVGVTVLHQATLKPANPSGARDGVQSQGPNAGAVVAVDGESHVI